MNRKISVGMAVTIVILAMTVTFSITMLIAMRLFDNMCNPVRESVFQTLQEKMRRKKTFQRSLIIFTIRRSIPMYSVLIQTL